MVSNVVRMELEVGNWSVTMLGCVDGLPMYVLFTRKEKRSNKF